MRKLAILALAALVVGLVAAPVLAGEGAKKNTHTVTVEFVSADMNAKTITFKDDKGEQKTAPVMDSAMKDLASLKGGEKIVCTCLDDAQGTHQGVTAIKVAMAKK